MSVRYIKSHSWNKLEAENPLYIHQKKGHLMIKDNYVYYQKNPAKKWITWRCRVCDAGCSIKYDDSIKECILRLLKFLLKVYCL